MAPAGRSRGEAGTNVVDENAAIAGLAIALFLFIGFPVQPRILPLNYPRVMRPGKWD